MYAILDVLPYVGYALCGLCLVLMFTWVFSEHPMRHRRKAAAEMKSAVLGANEAMKSATAAMLDTYFIEHNGSLKPKTVQIEQHGQKVAVPLITLIKQSVFMPQSMTLEVDGATIEFGQEDLAEGMQTVMDKMNRVTGHHVDTHPMQPLEHNPE